MHDMGRQIVGYFYIDFLEYVPCADILLTVPSPPRHRLAQPSEYRRPGLHGGEGKQFLAFALADDARVEATLVFGRQELEKLAGFLNVVLVAGSETVGGGQEQEARRLRVAGIYGEDITADAIGFPCFVQEAVALGLQEGRLDVFRGHGLQLEHQFS